MDRSLRRDARHASLARASVVVFICGIAVSGWALWNIFAVPAPVRPETSVERRLVVTGAATDATATFGPVAPARPAAPKNGDVFGRLTIPRLQQTFPLVQGTGEPELKRGVGHMITTVMPGEVGNCVISGHRDTVFSELGEVEKGDRLILETMAGRFTYEVDRIRIVDKEDRTVVVPTEDPVLTVSTCYPFRYVGSAPDRYVLIADLVVEP